MACSRSSASTSLLGFRQCLARHLGIVPGAEAVGRPGADQQPFLGRDVGQRELVGVEEARRHRGPQALRVARIAAAP